MEIIEPYFDKTFIFDSYSSRKNKGTHRAIKRLQKFAWKLSRNNTKVVWVLKCDIRKFFDSVDHDILLALIKKKIAHAKAVSLTENIIRSFQKEAVKEIAENTNQKLVGIGLLSDAVSKYYENNIPDVTVTEMTEALGELVREVIENY